MAVRPGYKRRYTSEEYKELQRQEAIAQIPFEIAAAAILPSDRVLTPSGFAEDLVEKVAADLGIDGSDDIPKTAVSRYWLYAGAGLIALLAAGPIYRLAATQAHTTPKKGSRKRSKAYTFNEQTAASLDAASLNATRVIASLAPAVALPVSYIGVQMMEDHGMITKGLGDAVQTLITVSASGQALSGVASLAGAVL